MHRTLSHLRRPGSSQEGDGLRGRPVMDAAGGVLHTAAHDDWRGLGRRLGLPFGQLRAAAREAERLGFESLWTPAEGVPDSFHICAAWSQDTSLRSGISVVPAARMWTPPGLAVQAARLAQLSLGRFVLGLGTGATGHKTDASGLPVVGHVTCGGRTHSLRGHPSGSLTNGRRELGRVSVRRAWFSHRAVRVRSPGGRSARRSPRSRAGRSSGRS
jgi:hypothetical protein